MKERIFISYKRDDKDVVFKLKDDIEKNVGVKCWVDLDAIESNAQFVNVIIKAIDAADIAVWIQFDSHGFSVLRSQNQIQSDTYAVSLWLITQIFRFLEQNPDFFQTVKISNANQL